MTIQQSQWVQKILSISDDSDLLAPLCTSSRKSLGAIVFKSILRSVSPSALPAAGSSSASQRYTPTRVTSATTSSRQGGTSLYGIHPRPSTDEDLILSESSDRLNDAHSPSSWVLIGVQGSSRTLKPTQVPIYESTMDYSFFRALRERYCRRRGMLRLWLSIWQLEHCEVVKVFCSVFKF